MTDIVERLRQCDENFELAQEAADEIERLRAALEKLVQTSLTAYHESEAAIAAASHHLTADMPVAAFFGTCRPAEQSRHGGSRAVVRASDRGRPVPTDHRSAWE